MNNENIKEKALNGMIWMFMERIGAQIVTFIVSLVLARLLLPDDYGIIAIAQIFINLANIFVVDGLSSALIQKRTVDDVDYCTAFFTNLGFAIVLYIIIFICAPAIAKFYNSSILTPVLRVLGLRLIIGSLNTIQRAYVSKNLLFKKFFFSTIVGTIISAFVGISFALMKFGVWAIVAQYLTNTLIDTIILWFTISWHPKLLFSSSLLKSMIGFGSKVFAASFFNEIYLELRSFIIGKKYGSADLAYYNRGKQFPQLFYSNIVSAITSVIFPVMSLKNDNKEQLKNGILLSIEISSYILFPIMFGLAMTSKPIVILLLTNKWEACIPFLQLYCVCYAILPIQSIIEQLYKAIGKANILIKLFFIEKIVGILIILYSMKFGVWEIAIGMLITSIICTIIHIIPLKKEIDFGLKDLIYAIKEPTILSLLMMVGVTIVQLFEFPNLVSLISQCIIGFFIYLIFSIILKSKSLHFILNILYQKTHLKFLIKIKSML